MSNNNDAISAVAFQAIVQFCGREYGTPLYTLEDLDEELLTENLTLSEARREDINTNGLTINPYRQSRAAVRLKQNLARLAEKRNTSEDKFAQARAIMSAEAETTIDNSRNIIEEIRAMRKVYYSCLELGKATGREIIGEVFQILDAATLYYRSCINTLESTMSFLYPEIIDLSFVKVVRDSIWAESQIRLSHVKELVDVINGFETNSASLLVSKGHTFYNIRKARSRPLPKKRPIIYYWQDESFYGELRELFWKYCLSQLYAFVKCIIINALSNWHFYID